eukprot:4390365-Amphidinium_carterae.1
MRSQITETDKRAGEEQATPKDQHNVIGTVQHECLEKRWTKTCEKSGYENEDKYEKHKEDENQTNDLSKPYRSTINSDTKFSLKEDDNDGNYKNTSD